MLACEILTAVLLVGNFWYQEVTDYGFTFSWVSWSVSAILLTIVLGWCFWYLK